jgi:hypothetical protein
MNFYEKAGQISIAIVGLAFMIGFLLLLAWIVSYIRTG